jgi:hypothetical protein
MPLPLLSVQAAIACFTRAVTAPSTSSRETNPIRPVLFAWPCPLLDFRETTALQNKALYPLKTTVNKKRTILDHIVINQPENKPAPWGFSCFEIAVRDPPRRSSIGQGIPSPETARPAETRKAEGKM